MLAAKAVDSIERYKDKTRRHDPELITAETILKIPKEHRRMASQYDTLNTSVNRSLTVDTQPHTKMYLKSISSMVHIEPSHGRKNEPMKLVMSESKKQL